MACRPTPDSGLGLTDLVAVQHDDASTPGCPRGDEREGRKVEMGRNDISAAACRGEPQSLRDEADVRSAR
jgi:hypothetical protein